jgi:hypothetical protein
MDRQKLKRLGDDLINVGYAIKSWYQERLTITDGKERHTYAEWKELRKGPTRKKWDQFVLRRTSWMRRGQNESFGQYLKRGLPALFFLTYTDLRDLRDRKKLLPFMIPTGIAAVLFPFWRVGTNATPLAVLFVGESAATLVFSLHVWVLLIGAGLTAGIMAPSIVLESREEIRQGIFWKEMFAPFTWAFKILAYPAIVMYRFARRFIVRPVTEAPLDPEEVVEERE